MTQKTFLSVLLILLLGISWREPMGFVFVFGVGAVLFRDSLTRFSQRVHSSWMFIVFGGAFGLIVEGLAVWSNSVKPASERILIDPDPVRDLFFGFFYYGLFVITWYFLLRRWQFSLWHIFAFSGLFGILTEQFNPVAGGPVILLQALVNPLVGIPLAFLIACVYGIFPSMAYFLTEHAFGHRTRVTGQTLCVVFIVLFAQWAFYGNVLLPFLKSLV